MNIKQAMKLNGFGNPESKIWFVGLEPHGIVDDLKYVNRNIRKFSALKMDHGREGIGICNTSVWRTCAEISRYLVTNKVPMDNNWYIQNRLFNKEFSNEYLVNMFPIPNHKFGNWRPIQERFGITRQQYLDLCLTLRWNKIRKEFQELSPQWLICFGAQMWNQYEHMFGFHQVYRNGRFRIGLTNKGQTVVAHTWFFNPRSFGQQDTINLINHLHLAKTMVQ